MVKIASVVRPHLLEEDQAAVQELLTQLEAQGSVPAHQLQVALRKAALGLHSKAKDESSAVSIRRVFGGTPKPKATPSTIVSLSCVVNMCSRTVYIDSWADRGAE